MIKKIDYLRKFALYRDFSWGTLAPFTKHNLIYGWNYSGKTTLSRLFLSLEDSTVLGKFSGSTFRIELEDGSEVTGGNILQRILPKVRVFNRDFIKKNFATEMSAPAIFIVGAQNLALKRRLEALDVRRENVRRIQARYREEADRIRNEIDRAGTDKARNIESVLGGRTFRRPNLEARVQEVRIAPESFLLSNDVVRTKLETCRTTSEWQRLGELSVTLPDWRLLTEGVTGLLRQTASNRAIERLKEDRRLEAWVRDGLAFHSDLAECEFCGATLSAERLDRLRAHFSQEYEALIRDVRAKIQALQNLSPNLPLPDSRDFAPELRAEAVSISDRFGSWLDAMTRIRDTFVEALNQKITNIETEASCEIDLSRVLEGEALLVEANQLIQRHNQAAAQLDQTKTEARVALEQHYAAEFIRDSDLASKETLRSKANQRNSDAQSLLGRISGKIESLEFQVRQQSIGAAKLNETLKFLLTDDNVEAIPLGGGSFEFRREGQLAENLSDGERTAIAFSYFLVSLEANGAVLSDIIVFIDDPISSLDSNHIYAVYALIVKRLSECKQFFVSTHNSELFNLIKGLWSSSRNRPSGGVGFYYTNRSIENGQWCCALVDLPILLRKHKSEYHFVFEHLYKFANNASPTLHEAYTAPNLLRKFLEAYLGFRKPCVSAWSDKLDLLGFTTEAEQCEIQKFSDDASHLQGISRAMQQPTFIPSAQANVKKVINGLQSEDYEHYHSLCTLIGVTP